MPLIKESVPCTKENLIGFVCHKCEESYEDVLEIQEMLYWRMTGGYGSIWGDGNTVELCLCQDCAFALLTPYIRNCGDDDE